MFIIRSTTAAMCMKGILYELVTIGNIDGSKLPDMSYFMAASVVTRLQAREYEKEFASLKASNQFVNGDKEPLMEA